MLIHQPWGISAYGTATVYAEPDHAVVRLAVNRTGNKPEQALAAATDAVAAVRRTLRARGVPDSDVTASRTSIRSAWDGWGANRKFLGHHCRVELTIRVSQMDATESLVVELIAAGAEEIIGVEYGTGKLSELRAEARRQAIAAARTKAELYADAAGVAVGPVIHIEDVDPGSSKPVYRGAAAGAEAAVDQADFAPGQLTISVAVALGFSIAH
jgi:uncharacterized protein YggE